MSVSLQIGMSVKIQRSNGRIHDATVTAINLATQLATVEWNERGEMKGKEIDFPALLDLNPTVSAPQRENLRSASKKKPASAPRVTEFSRKQAPSPRVLADDHRLNSPIVEDRSRATPARVRSLMPPLPLGRGGRKGPLVAKEPDEKSQAAAAAAQAEKEEKEARFSLAAPAAKRRSRCVKEVEKIKKQREERRAKQANKIQQRREDCDPTNPNWEFLQMIREFRSHLNMQPMQMSEPVVPHRICVCVRKRPINKKEIAKKDIDVVTIPNKDLSLVHECKLKVDLTKYLENQQFRFDYSFDEHSTNSLVYKYAAQPLVATIFDRGMATCFAYGQTGSGKTHTMGGDFQGKEQDCTKGIYALAAQDVFKLAHLPKNKAKDLTVSCSFFEIYSGKVFDLLNDKERLNVLEDGNQVVQIVGLEEVAVTGVDDVLTLIQRGNEVRTSGTTSANQHSSRSHAIFQIILRKRVNRKLYGKFSLIDLAGNERGADTSSSNRQTRMEGAEINKSLLALKECIRALGRKGAHLPFRASKLTQVLRDSFIGDRASTCMIAMISPGLSSCEHTLNTLRYADRVKELEVSSSSVARAPNGGNAQGGAGAAAAAAAAAADRSPVDNDLLLLHRSLKADEEEASVELLTFHEAVSHLLEGQDQLIEDHRTVVQDSKDLIVEEEQLLELVNDLDGNYDIENYVNALDEILAKKEAHISRLKQKVEDFKKQLQEEEAASKKVKKMPYV
ncbi:kinesin-like protein KIF2A [Oscarella lobularis]|uniref:kinesin-like protein KIF2A n=1 Tax=Oscarella lobularis TaxID=121494 RepID=UPI003313936E